MAVLFETPGGVCFTCSQCGDCCRDVNIQLQEGERAELEALDWNGVADDLAGVRPAVRVDVPGAGSVDRLARKDDGRCVFLGNQNQCRIHQHFGAEAKPLMCRLYPFGFHRVADRVTVDVSFSCSAVSRGAGAPVRERRPEWQALLDDELGAPLVQKHWIDDGRPLDDAILLEFERFLLGFLANEDLSVFDRIRCLLQYVRLATTGDPQLPVASELRRAIAVGLPRQIVNMPWQGHMDKTQRAIFFQWLYLMLNPAPPNVDQLGKRARRQVEKKRIDEGNRYQHGSNRPIVDNRELSATFEEIATVDGSFLEHEGREAWLTYVRAKIVGHRYLVAGEEILPVKEALPKFLLVYPMAIWTSQALAADRGSTVVERTDLERAVRLLDRSVGQLPTSRLPKKQAEACDFVMLETDFVVAARNELLQRGPAKPE